MVLAFGDVAEAEHVPGLFFLVELLLVLQAAFLFIEDFLVVVDEIDHFRHFLADAEDVLVSPGDGLGHILPLLEQLVPLIVLLLELFCGFVELNLGGLGGGDFLLQFLLFPADFDGQFLDLQVEFPDLGVVFLPVLLEGDVVFLLLLASDGPLLQLLLVPVEFQLDLLDLLVHPEDAHLDVVEPLLVLHDHLIELLDLVLQSAALPLRHLPEVVFGFGLFVLGVDQRLRVEEFLVHIL